MIYHVGLENGAEGRTIAWVLGHPGCFAYGANAEQALTSLPAAIRDYVAWVDAHTDRGWLPADEIEIQLDESFQVYTIDSNYDLAEDGYEVGAWFRHDWRPLTAEDIAHGLALLEWSRADLLATLEGLSDEMLNVKKPTERWSIGGIVKHIGGAEWWYLDRLGLAFPRDEVPDDPFERLRVVRVWLLETLPALGGSRQVVGMEGEFWSPRKMLRRAVWHERDHTQHIAKLIGA